MGWRQRDLKTKLAQPVFLFLLLPVWIMFEITTFPTPGQKWSSLPFMQMSASLLMMWHPSHTSLPIGLEKFLTIAKLFISILARVHSTRMMKKIRFINIFCIMSINRHFCKQLNIVGDCMSKNYGIAKLYVVVKLNFKI